MLLGCGGAVEPAIDGAAAPADAAALDAASSADAAVVPANDSDLDGLSDAQEDLDGDGVVDPGESDPTMADSDGDGATDLIEWAAGSDPLDPTSVPPTGALSLVVPYGAGSVTGEVSFQADIHAVDVVFLLDTMPGSMAGALITLGNALQTVIVPSVSLVVPDAAFAVAHFTDFPVLYFGGTTDVPYALDQRITTDIADVQAVFDALYVTGGADWAQSSTEALYQSVTGEGIAWTVGHPGEVEKFEPLIGYEPAAGHGVLGGVGFRHGAYPIVAHLSENPWRDASDYWAAGIVEAHTRDEAVDAAYNSGVRVAGGTSNPNFVGTIIDVAFDTRAVVPASALPTAPPSHCIGGMCAVTVPFDPVGSNVPVADVVETLLSYAPLDVFARASGPIVSGVDPETFVESIVPASPAPPGTVVDGDTLRMVPPGSTVPFTVTLRNDLVMSGPVARVWSLTLFARAEAWIDLGDAVTLTVIVPAHP